jgi:hypothetical protein
MLFAIALTILAIFVIAVLAKFQRTNSKPSYDWEPALSNKVLDLKTPNRYGNTNDKTIILVEKNEEELAEDRRSYLRENRK